MLKKTKLTYRGINQDITKSKRSPEFYFDAENIRIQATDSGTTGSITNDKGNVLVYTLPANQVVIGHAVLKDYLVTFSTYNNVDKITRIKFSDFTGFELFSGDINLDPNHLIETEVYYESDDIQKVYWVDGLNQLRHINIITDTPYTSEDATMFDAVPEVAFSAPYVSSIEYGGIHTAGMIQYAYNLVKQNGSQSAVSPFSELYPLNKTLGGGDLNEYVGKILTVTIDEVDTKYDIIRLYAIKYTSYNEQPSINIIAEESIGNNTSFEFSDDGRVIRAISADQLTFLGGTAVIPSTITSKYNRLILGNIKEVYFDVDGVDFDTRAYRFPISSLTSEIYNHGVTPALSITWDTDHIEESVSGNLIASDHDCINTDFDTYNYKLNSTTIGATGTNVDIEIVQKTVADGRSLLKSGETYRFGIEFFNNRGQCSAPKWICDLKIPKGNLAGNDCNTLKVTLKNESALVALGVVGWRVLRVERTDADKTILCQGIVSTMMFQKYDDVAEANMVNGVTYANLDLLKIPSPFIRNNTKLYETWKRKPADAEAPFIYQTKHGVCIGEESSSGEVDDPRQEIYRVYATGTERHLSFEETRLMQLYSPEITFTDVNLSEGLKLNFSHAGLNSIANSAIWAKQYNTDTSFTENELKRYTALSLYRESGDKFSAFNQYARIGGTGDHNLQNKYQYYRKYFFNKYVNGVSYDILGTPMLVGTGQSGLRYNNDSKYGFTNVLGTILTDKNDKSTKGDSGDDGIISVNSIAGKNITLVTTLNSKYEDILTAGSLINSSNGVFEIVRTISNQYGGNTYESRSRNSYLRIGRYLPITTLENQIDNPGDTFVGFFRFARIIANPVSVQNSKYYDMTEIVEFPVETSIDVANRSDLSTSWDSKFMPTFDEYHKYNRVYSQQPIFNRTTATPFTFQERRVFDNRVNATKVKTNGEIVDSWTDVLVNEELYVDGKYGSITEIIQNNDIVYCIQEQAVSILEISPRVQTVATDGTAIELGRGAVLYNYKYLNTNSGCTHQQAVFKSQNSVYYIDVINKSINRIIGTEVAGISDLHGLHSFLYNNLDYNTLKGSNLVTGCFDQITNDAYFTTPAFTIVFNEQSNTFTSRYSFKPQRYIFTVYGLLSTANGNSIWKHGVGEYGSYYGVVYPSMVTLVVAPEPDIDCIFNNGEFKSEVYSDGIDVFNKTIDTIECWNEYQSTGSIALTVGGNIKRKFRDWNFFIPRSTSNPLQRMRGQWLYIKLGYNNIGNDKLVLHDMIVSYDSVNKI